MGINSGEVLRSRGGRFNATIKPNPRVTADVPNGSIIIGSMNALNFELTLRDKAKDAGMPSASEITTAPIAYIREVMTDRVGVT